ncbi:hypothetical protein Ctha_0477 [Chloroherpeton thalassium ATCC 35110]|uniref:Uncharacterized protein n=1 Tax=Chloroherpeton thalassium (strain ATCC 35110 / GB-78) TaxID=517418 RepID=B3QUP2_CHLT3|nr:hypothetical protein Ctha_0477 [Chloroherpeton thalassium ATCC 35110]
MKLYARLTDLFLGKDVLWTNANFMNVDCLRLTQQIWGLLFNNFLRSSNYQQIKNNILFFRAIIIFSYILLSFQETPTTNQLNIYESANYTYC